MPKNKHSKFQNFWMNNYSMQCKFLICKKQLKFDTTLEINYKSWENINE
jgi:hypothetical protein